MTQREKEKIEVIHETLSRIEERQTEMGNQLDRVDRFIYGDPENEVPGLVERQRKDEERLDNLEKDINAARVISRFFSKNIGKIITAAVAVVLTLAGASAEKIQTIIKNIIDL